MVPRLQVASSGFSTSMTRSRSSIVCPVAPPVVIEITASLSSLMPEQYSRKTPGSEMGLPSSGSRAWRWMTAAPSPGGIDRLADVVLHGDRYVTVHGGRVGGPRHRARDYHPTHVGPPRLAIKLGPGWRVLLP